MFEKARVLDEICDEIDIHLTSGLMVVQAAEMWSAVYTGTHNRMVSAPDYFAYAMANETIGMIIEQCYFKVMPYVRGEKVVGEESDER